MSKGGNMPGPDPSPRTWSAHSSTCARQTLVLLAAIVAGSLLAPTRSCVADDRPKSSTSRVVRDAAIQALPFDRLTAEARAKIENVISHVSIYRHVPTEMIPCDPDMFLFLSRHPEVVVGIWDLMGITQIQLERTGAFTFSAADQSGITADVELLYGTHDTQIMYADGVYDGPLFRNPVQGVCLLVLRSKYYRDALGQTHVKSALDVFLRVNHAGAELLTRTLHPLVGRATDYNMLETTRFFGKISQAAESNGPGIQRMATRLTQIEPIVQQQFARVAGDISDRASQRRALVLNVEELAESSRTAIQTSASPPASIYQAGGRQPRRKFVVMRR